MKKRFTRQDVLALCFGAFVAGILFGAAIHHHIHFR